MKKFFFSTSALILGLILSYTFPQPINVKADTCYYSYCDTYDSKCKANQNATNCLGPGGQEPCTSSSPCFDPGEN